MSLAIYESDVDDSIVVLNNDCFVINRELDNSLYDVTFNALIDINRAIDKKAFKLKFQICEGDRDFIDQKILDLLDSVDIIDRKRGKYLLSSLGNNSIVYSEVIDITKFLNNQSLNKKSKKSTLQVSNIVQESTNDSLLRNSIKIPYKLFQQEIDFKLFKMKNSLPSIIDRNYNDIDPTKLINGTFQKIKYNDLYSSYVFSRLFGGVNEKKTYQFISKSESNYLTVNSNFFVLNLSGLSTVHVYVDLLDLNNQVLQSLQKTIEIGNQLPALAFSDKKPSFSIIKNHKTELFMIKRSDEKNQSNVIIKASEGNLESLSDNSDFTIRAAFHSGNKIISDFSSVSIFNRRRDSSFCVGNVSAYQKNKTISLKANNLDSKTVSVVFYAKNLTLKSKPVQLGSMILVGTNNLEVSNTHENFIEGHIFEYYAISYLTNGLSKKTKSVVFETYQVEQTQINVEISNLVIDNDVNFTIDVVIQDKSTDNIFNLLRDRGLDSYFTGNIEDQKTQLKNFIAFSIFRTNLLTGDRAYIGTQLSNTFLDSEVCKLKSIPVYTPNIPFQYEIYPSLIDPNTMFDDQPGKIKNVGEITPYNQQKFKHFLCKKNSMLVTSEGLKQKFSSSILDHMIIGTPALVLTDANDVDETLSDIQVEYLENLNPKRVKISWEINENEFGQQIDYVIIGKIENGNRSLIGKRLRDARFFIDVKPKNGITYYSILPVYKDGSMGNHLYEEIQIL